MREYEMVDDMSIDEILISDAETCIFDGVTGYEERRMPVDLAMTRIGRNVSDDIFMGEEYEQRYKRSKGGNIW